MVELLSLPLIHYCLHPFSGNEHYQNIKMESSTLIFQQGCATLFLDSLLISHKNWVHARIQKVLSEGVQL